MSAAQPPVSKTKTFYLKLGGAVFVLLIFGFYIANLGNLWRANSERTPAGEDLEWNKLKNTFKVTLERVSREFKAARNKQVVAASNIIVTKLVSDINLSASSSSSTPEVNLASSSPILINVLETAASTTETTTSTATTLDSLKTKLDLNAK